MRTTRRAVRLGAITLAAAVLTGCSVTGDDGAAKGSTAATSQDATKDAGAGNTDTAGSGAGLADVSPEEIIAEQTYTVPGSPDDKVTVGVHSLVVDGEMMTLSLYFTPDFGSQSDEAEISVFDMVGSAFGPTLIDRANLKEYLILEENITTEWASDQVHTTTTDGEPVLWFGGYAAPEDEIDSIDLRVIDELPEFTDVPITR